MIRHDGEISTQCASGYADFWAAHRDRAGPLTPADVWGLREDREFVPPSLGHRKRLARVRPEITPVQVRVADPDGGRADVKRRIAMSREVLAACGCLPKPHTTIPSDYVRPAPVEPGAARVADDHAERRRECIEREVTRIAAYGSDELSRAWRLWLTR